MRSVRWLGGILAGVVVVSGATWAVASQTMRSPADVAAEAEAPDPGPVTVPVERRALESEVIVRGTVGFDEPLGVDLAGTPAVDGQAEGPVVATWLPEPDDEVAEGDVVLEVSGRPVLALEGDVPAYRDLRRGMDGDDVAQLQEALQRLDHLDAGGDGQFGPVTQAAVDALYEDVGHEPAGPSAEEEERLTTAERRVSSARQQVDDAEAARATAEQAPPASGEDPAGTAPGEGSAGTAAADLRAAERELADAERELADAREAAGTWLPAGEVVYLPELPQRVDDVAVELGDEASGELLTVSSSEVVIETSVPADDAGLIAVGDEVEIGEEGDAADGTIAELADEAGTGDADDDRHEVLIDPSDAAEDLLDESLRIRIPVESTDGEVLAVPLAAVSAGADGSSRVEVVDDEDDDGDDGAPATSMVRVEPGLTADGMVEIEPVETALAPDDLVVVGADPDEDVDEGDGP